MNSAILDLFFYLLRLGLKTEKADENILVGFRQLKNNVSNQAWEDVYNLGAQQGVAAIQFIGLQQLADMKIDLPFQMPDRKLKMKWFAHAMQVENHCKSHLNAASELADIYAENGIRTVVLKGLAVGQFYPNPWCRSCGDLDCFLMDRYEDGNIIAEKSGAKVERDFYKHSHINYKGLEVENHQFCTPIRGSKKTKAFERLLQSVLIDKGTSMIRNTKLECPPPMFNALFLTYHAHGHFLSEGIALRHLTDWAMLIHHQGDKIDWVKFRCYCTEYGLNHFADAMASLAEKHLKISIPNSYSVEKIGRLESALMDGMLQYRNQDYSNVWKVRLDSVLSVFKNHQRYKLFSDSTAFTAVMRQIYGFVFDKHPHL